MASAASLNNYGTLGGGGNLRLNAPALLNERGLLFSGADMTLRAGDITNLYGDVYSLGRLDIARDDAGNRAASLVHILDHRLAILPAQLHGVFETLGNGIIEHRHISS